MGLPEDTSKRVICSSVLSMTLSVLIVSSCFLGALVFFPAILYQTSSKVLYVIQTPVTTNFATFTPISVQIPAQGIEYSIAPDFSNVVNFDGVNLSSEEKESLKTLGFLVIPSIDYGEMYEIYPSLYNRNDLIPNFVTTDIIIHMFHTLVYSVITQTENDYFSESLLELTQQILTSSYKDYISSTEPWKSAARMNTAIFGVASRLLDENTFIPEELDSLVSREIDLITNYQITAESPILGRPEDYSCYIPFGHYLETEQLTRYYQSKTWLGRIEYHLQSNDPTVSIEQIKNGTRQVILISRIVKNTPSLFDSWKKIYEVSTFFEGHSEDLTLSKYIDLLSDFYGGSTSLSAIESNLDLFISKVIENASLKGNPFFDTDEVGYRFLNLPSLPDSTIFQELSITNRLIPSALDLMSLLGSSRAYQHLGSEQGIPEYQEAFLELNQTFSRLQDSDWTNNFYWLWLYSLMPLLSEKSLSFPQFMRQASWQDKDLLTALGAWTEFHQDTHLYVRNPSSGGDIKAEYKTLKGYAEPNPEVYARLASLCKMLYDGLNNRNLLKPVYKNKILAFNSLLLSLKVIAEKELEGISLSNEEHRLLNYISNFLEWISTDTDLLFDQNQISSGFPETYHPPSWQSIYWLLDEGWDLPNMAQIQTVFENSNVSSLLYEGTGTPFVIYVIIPIDNELFLTRGAVFSYYELKFPSNQEISNKNWQDMLTSEEAPNLPVWTQSYIVHPKNSFFDLPVLQTLVNYNEDRNHKYVLDLK